MIKRVAVDPELPSTPDRLFLLARDLRVARGRYLEVLVRSWRAEVAAHGRRLVDTRDRARFEEGLKRLLLVSGASMRRRQVDDRSWTAAIGERAPYLDAIATDRLLPLANAISYDDIEADAPAWHMETTLEITRDAAAYARALGPLVWIADRVLIVDPYFLKNSRSMGQFLAAMARRAVGREPLERITLNTVDHGSPSKVAESVACAIGDLEHHTSALAALTRSIEVVVWGSSRASGRMHDRFFLTDVGGVGLGNWIDAGGRGVASLSLLDEGAWALLRARFDVEHPDHPNSAPYPLEHRATVDVAPGGFAAVQARVPHAF